MSSETTPTTDAPTTKYSVNASSRWRWDGNPHLSDHALQRWDERTPPTSVSPEKAWATGPPAPKWLCQALTSNTGETPDSARLWAGRDDQDDAFAAIMLVRDSPNRAAAMVTVYDVASIESSAVRAACWALVQSAGLV